MPGLSAGTFSDKAFGCKTYQVKRINFGWLGS